MPMLQEHLKENNEPELIVLLRKLLNKEKRNPL